jgi:alanine racemase
MNNSKCTLQINLRTIQKNYITLCNYCPNSEVGATVKSNSYGLGTNHIAPILAKSGCKHFFVSSCEEGVELRTTLGSNANIYIFNGIFQEEIQLFLEYKLVPILNHLLQIKLWQKQAVLLNKILPCIIHIDTGMHRLGLTTTEFKYLKNDEINGLNILYIMSHLSSGHDITNPSNQIQLNRFINLQSKFKKMKYSFANSSGIFLGRQYHFNLTRPGAAIYGINTASHIQKPIVTNPIKLFAPIIQIHNLPPAESIGYNSTYTNIQNKNRLIGTVPIGYADGLTTRLSNKAICYINGYKAPVLGRISMDLMTIDLTEIPKNVTLLGAQVEVIGNNCLPSTLAKLSGINSYETLTALNKSKHKRIYFY